MKITFKKIVGLLLGTIAAFSLATSAYASKTKIADVSQYQGTINWSKASKELKLAIIRVQHGDSGDSDFVIDTKKDTNANGAYKYGVPFGQYGFAEFSSASDAKKEAKDFYKRASKHARFYVLDNEKRKGSGSEQSYVNAWLSTMRSLTKKPLVYYSYQNYVNTYKINYSKFDGSWIANYSTKPNVSADLWQYTSSGSLAGVSGRVDLSRVLNSKVVNSWISSTNKSTYFTSIPSSKKIKALTTVYQYGDVNLKSKVSKTSPNQVLSVKSIERSNGGAYRFQLTNGNYVSANQQLVSSY